MAIKSTSRFDLSDNIADAIANFMDDYRGDVIEALTEVIPKVAKESAQKLRATSPRGKKGQYAKGWTYKVEKRRLKNGAEVYGKHGTYQLAHLLEFEHPTGPKKGGHYFGKVHIATVNDWAQDEAYERMMERLERL